MSQSQSGWGLVLRYDTPNGITASINRQGYYTISFTAYATHDNVILNAGLSTKDISDKTIDYSVNITSQMKTYSFTINYQDSDISTKPSILRFWHESVEDIIIVSDIQLEPGTEATVWRESTDSTLTTLDWSAITNKPSTFTPPIASTTTLGGVKAGANITILEDGTINANDNPAAFIRKQERFTLSGGQTDFTLTQGNYKPGTSSITWYINGDKQDDRALTESSSTTVSIPSGLPDGLDVMFEYFETINMNPFPYHASEHLSTGVDSIPDATDNQDGLMSATDKEKIDGLASVASSGNYADLIGKPVLSTIAISGSYNDLSNLPALKTVATSGSYDDLINKPTLGTAASLNTGLTTGNVVTVGSDGLIDSSLMPSIAISDSFSVSSQSAMLALTAQVGDIAIRTDLNQTFILHETPASTLANWLVLATPTDVVQSVAGKTGTVVLTSSDVGLGNVNNTADSTKSVASAAKLITARTISITGDGTGSTSFDGSANSSIMLVLANTGVSSGTYTKLTVNAKGQVTSATTLSASDIPNLDWSKITSGKPTTLSGYGITDGALTTDIPTKLSQLDNDLGIQVKTTTSDTEPSSPTGGDYWYQVVS